MEERPTSVNVHEAKTHLSRLLVRVENGEEIVIARSGVPIARLIPADRRSAQRALGADAGAVVVPDDFDSPLPTDVLDAFEG